MNTENVHFIHVIWQWKTVINSYRCIDDFPISLPLFYASLLYYVFSLFNASATPVCVNDSYASMVSMSIKYCSQSPMVESLLSILSIRFTAYCMIRYPWKWKLNAIYVLGSLPRIPEIPSGDSALWALWMGDALMVSK